MKSNRNVLFLMIGVAALFAGCKATTTAHNGPDAVYLAPEYPTMKLESLAYLGLAALVPDRVAISTADALVRSYLTGGQQKLLIVDESTVRSRAVTKGVEADLDRAIRAWKDKRSVDGLVLKSLGRDLGLDGFVVADLTRWREEQVEWTSEGNSFTEVALSISIYDARTGLLAWKGEKMERRESLHYRHGAGVGSGVYQDDQGIERTERADRVTPPPPPAEEVAESVVQDLILGLPEKPSSKP